MRLGTYILINHSKKIMVSGDLDENIIKELLKNKAPIDSFAVGMSVLVH